MSDQHSGRILLFTGEGKGKTTAALGMALRAAGHGLKTCVFQFVKAGAATGELAGLRHVPGVEIVQLGRGFLPKKESPEFSEHRQAAQEGLVHAAATLASGACDLVILDEIAFAVARGLLDEEPVVEAVRKAAPGTIVVMTGRHATPGLIAIADTATEMRLVKHGFKSGRKAQPGVEF